MSLANISRRKIIIKFVFLFFDKTSLTGYKKVVAKNEKKGYAFMKRSEKYKIMYLQSCLLLSFLGIHRGRKRGLLPAFAGKGHKLEKR